MKLRVFFLTAVSLLLASVAQAQTVEFRGNGHLKARTQACLDGGFSDFSFTNFRFRPANVGSNPDQARLSVYFDHFSTNHIVDGGLTNSFKVYQGGGLGSGIFRFRGRMTKNRQVPSSITPTTDFVTLAGVIRNYGAVRGCTMVFEANMELR